MSSNYSLRSRAPSLPPKHIRSTIKPTRKLTEMALESIFNDNDQLNQPGLLSPTLIKNFQSFGTSPRNSLPPKSSIGKIKKRVASIRVTDVIELDGLEELNEEIEDNVSPSKVMKDTKEEISEDAPFDLYEDPDAELILPETLLEQSMAQEKENADCMTIPVSPCHSVLGPREVGNMKEYIGLKGKVFKIAPYSYNDGLPPPSKLTRTVGSKFFRITTVNLFQTNASKITKFVLLSPSKETIQKTQRLSKRLFPGLRRSYFLRPRPVKKALETPTAKKRGSKI